MFHFACLILGLILLITPGVIAVMSGNKTEDEAMSWIANLNPEQQQVLEMSARIGLFMFALGTGLFLIEFFF